jgi:hypothetical protein
MSGQELAGVHASQASEASQTSDGRRDAVRITQRAEGEKRREEKAAKPLNPRLAAAHAPWIRPLTDYERREAHEFACSRYG